MSEFFVCRKFFVCHILKSDAEFSIACELLKNGCANKNFTALHLIIRRNLLPSPSRLEPTIAIILRSFNETLFLFIERRKFLCKKRREAEKAYIEFDAEVKNNLVAYTGKLKITDFARQ